MSTAPVSPIALAGALLAVLMPMHGMSAGLESADFDGYAVASDRELAAMRGGFEINIGGQMLSLAFSLERVSLLNGELQALTRIVVPDLAAAILSPQTVKVEAYVAPSPMQGGEIQDPSPQITAAIVPASPASRGSASDQVAASYVTFFPNGVGNNVDLGQEISKQVNEQVNRALQAAQAQFLQPTNDAFVLQNALDNQTIQTMTRLNFTLINDALARAVELNDALRSLANMPNAVPH